MARITLPDGSVLEVADGATLRQVAERIGSGLAKAALVGRIDGKLVDLSCSVQDGAQVQIITAKDAEGLDAMRHSCAHVMAEAICRIWPQTRLVYGPTVEDGFYYDIDLDEPIRPDDFARIEAEMAEIAKADQPFVRQEMGRNEALAKLAGDKYKTDNIQRVDSEVISFYSHGDGFQDLCRGPHVPSTGKVGAFKVMSVAGAYWHGDATQKMLQRVYGTSWPTKKDLDEHLNRLEEAKRRDHRVLGRQLDLFSFSEMGPGFAFMHPKGMVIWNEIVGFLGGLNRKYGYKEIKTPIILNEELWRRSGHWDHYKENMYFTEIDDAPFAVKPMNCPGGILVYNSAIRSYRELPLRMAELGFVHRHERSGALHGLMRVRAFTQDDAHIYCTPEQIKDEIKAIMELDRYVYQDVFGFKYFVELSTRPENSMGDPELWDIAEQRLKEALEETGTAYKLNPGDGAFYGPKIDFHLEDCIGRTWQCGTIQLDFQMPEKFDMTYIGSDGAEHRPVMLHRTVLGSLERFMGILIENYAGAFPYWLAPVQVKLLQVSSDFAGYADELAKKFRDADIRVEIDARDEKLGKKIRDAQMQKIPYMLVIGAREVEEGTVAVRERSKGDF